MSEGRKVGLSHFVLCAAFKESLVFIIHAKKNNHHSESAKVAANREFATLCAKHATLVGKYGHTNRRMKKTTAEKKMQEKNLKS